MTDPEGNRIYPDRLSLWRSGLIMLLAGITIVVMVVLGALALILLLPILVTGFVILYPIRIALRRLSGPLWGRRWGLL